MTTRKVSGCEFFLKNDGDLKVLLVLLATSGLVVEVSNGLYANILNLYDILTNFSYERRNHMYTISNS